MKTLLALTMVVMAMAAAPVVQANEMAGQKMIGTDKPEAAPIARAPGDATPTVPVSATGVGDVPDIMKDEPEALPAAVSDTAALDEKGCPIAPKGPPACLPMTGSFDDSNDLADCLSQMNGYVKAMNSAYVCSRDPALREEMRRVARDFADAAGSTR